MTPDHIYALVANGESETLEFKRTTGTLREAAQALCAMINHRGGCVLFGVESDGRVVGQQVSDRTIEEIARELGEIDPPVFPTIDRVSIGAGAEVLIIHARPGPNCPYSYRGHAYQRVGNTNQKLSRDQYNRILLERVHADERWENRPAIGWTVSDLDCVELIRTLEEAIRRGRIQDPGTRDPAAIVSGLGLMKDGILFRAAVVLFASNNRLASELPQCLLRVARFVGIEKTEFRDNRQFRGHAFNLLSEAERFLLDHMPVAGRVVPGKMERIDLPHYPPLAIREALANAFCHRDYSLAGGSVSVAIFDDRLEVTSSGSLHFGLTPDALFRPHESMPWNPLIANVLYRRGVIESWGRGTLKMVELATSAGLPKPEIFDVNGSVTVRFRPTKYVAPERVAKNLTPRQRAILAQVATMPEGFPVRDIASALGLEESPWLIQEDLSWLKNFGLLRRSGWGRGARWSLVTQ